jgi:hypothetical protein
MRTALNDKAVVCNEKKELCGVILGYDYCAEHEWGIKDIRRKYQMDDEAIGIDKRRIREAHKDLNMGSMTIDKKTYYYLTSFQHTYGTPAENVKHTREVVKRSLGFYGNKEIYSAWDEGDFAFAVEDKKVIDEIWEAFQRKDIAIFGVGNSNPFGGTGLAIFIISKLSEIYIKSMKDSDEDHIALNKAAEKTGIAKKLENANKKFKNGSFSFSAPFSYYALSPSWMNEKQKNKSKYPVMFWLNPANQDRVNYGWFTVEDLEMWLQNKGPIPKKNFSELLK